MKVTNSNPHPKTLLAEDGSTIYVHPGVHHNINSKFGWNLPHRVKQFNESPRQVVASHTVGKPKAPVTAMETALSSARAARVPDTKAE